MSRIWTCKIGTSKNVELPLGADSPMRDAVMDAFKALTGEDAEFAFTGWGGKLDEGELAIVENRLPEIQTKMAAAVDAFNEAYGPALNEAYIESHGDNHVADAKATEAGIRAALEALGIDEAFL